MHIAKVIVNLSLDKPFDYLIPPALEKSIRLGMQVKVPFGHSERNGYVLGITDQSDYPPEKLKAIAGISEKHPQIPDSLLRLGKWMADYYCCSREQAVRALLPGAVRSGKIKQKTIKHYYLESSEKAQDYVFQHGKRSPARARIIQELLQHPGMLAERLLSAADSGPAPLKALVKAGIVNEELRKINRDPFAGAEIVSSLPRDPTPEQKQALALIDQVLEKKSKPHTVLLHGVTGSGKTEVYLQAIAKIMDEGKDTIVLVPEISLTPQTTERFRARFGNNVSVLHSALSDGERFDEWNKIYQGKVKIVVGARSALFAPFLQTGRSSPLSCPGRSGDARLPGKSGRDSRYGHPFPGILE